MTKLKKAAHAIYRVFYMPLGGRQWTHISQDSIKSKKAAWIFGMLVLGIVAGSVFDWRGLLAGLGVGFVLGHIFWTSAGQHAREAQELLRRINVDQVVGPAIGEEVETWQAIDRKQYQ